MKEPTGSPAKRGYAWARKRTRSRSACGMTSNEASVRVFEAYLMRGTRLRADELHFTAGVDSHGPQRATRAPPGDRLAQGRHPGIVLNQLGDKILVCVERPGEAESRSEVGMPDAHPETVHVPAALRELERVLHPGSGILDATVLAQRAVHPGERHLVEWQRRRCCIAPHREHVRDAKTESVPIGEAGRGVEGEAGAGHVAMRRPRS